MTQKIEKRVEDNQVIQKRINKINQGIVPEGYKQTKVGIIPEDWEVKKLGELGEVFRGKGIPKSKISEHGTPCIIYGEMYTSYNNIINDVISSTDEETALDSFELKYGDILFTSSGETAEEIGKSAMYLNDATAYAGGDMVILRPEPNIKNEVYGYLLNMDYVREQKYKKAQGHSVVHLYGDHIKSIYVPVINQSEQQKIADVLSTWDRAIELKEVLIKEKEEQKKGLMKNLISSKENWNTSKLGDVLFNRNETGYPELELIAVTREKGIIKRDELDRKDTSSANKERYKLVLPNDIAYNTMRMWQGVSGISKYRGIVSPAYTVLEPNVDKIDPLFTAYMFKLESIINIFRRYSQGLVKDTLNLKYPNFSKIKLKFPPLTEQKRIAEILSTADREIELLKDLVEELKEEKKGLMQLLLTGIVRVKGEDDE